MKELAPLFAELAQLKDGERPYPHQLEAFARLRGGKPVLLLAPIGSGKSEAVFVPFLDLRRTSLPSRLLYTLPMRTLVNSLADRFQKPGSHYDPGLGDSALSVSLQPDDLFFLCGDRYLFQDYHCRFP